jgi:hypothetical protein
MAGGPGGQMVEWSSGRVAGGEGTHSALSNCEVVSTADCLLPTAYQVLYLQ